MLEYRVIMLRTAGNQLGDATGREAQLNECAAEGWRVVPADVGDGLLLLKRRGGVVLSREEYESLLKGQSLRAEEGEG